jgi:hypothetical protein
VDCFLEATQEAQDHMETEIARAADLQFARRKQALQIVNSKLVNLIRTSPQADATGMI